MAKKHRDILTESYHFLVHLPNACSSWSWAMAKPQTWNSTQVSHAVAGTQALRHHLWPPQVLDGRKLELETELGLKASTSNSG